MAIAAVNEANFDKTAASAEYLVLDFYADWCPHCRRLAPTVEALADEYAGKTVIAKVDLDENQKLGDRFEVESIPTLVLLKKGQLVDTLVGPNSKGEIVSWMKEHGAI